MATSSSRSQRSRRYPSGNTWFVGDVPHLPRLCFGLDLIWILDRRNKQIDGLAKSFKTYERCPFIYQAYCEGWTYLISMGNGFKNVRSLGNGDSCLHWCHPGVSSARLGLLPKKTPLRSDEPFSSYREQQGFSHIFCTCIDKFRIFRFFLSVTHLDL